MTNSTYSSTSLAEQAYSYKYDAFGRMVESRVPGCAPAKFRYSRAGRLVAEHPAAMADGKWLLHFYDRAGREVLSSVASPTEAQLQSLCDTLRTAYYFGHNLYGGYKFSSDLPCDIGQIQKATYYDDYSFVTRTDADFGFDASACPFDKSTALARGLVAGETDYSQGLDPAPGTVYVYDADGRVVRQYAMLRRGRHALVRTFDTAGNVLTEDESLCNGTTPHISRHTDNTYDSAGRLISTDISENGKSASVKRFYGQNGLLSKEKFGNGVDRTYRYDVHGWPTSNTIGLAPLTLPAIPAGTLSATYYNSLDGGLRGDRDPDDYLVRDRYTETLLYADGLYPRYSGCPSAKETSLGGRYDYRFDAHDRLTKADYTAPDSEGEDFSTEYTYDDLGNPLTLKRYGIIDYTSGGEATYGLLDDLTFSYPSGSSQLESVTSAAEGTDFYGRVGFPLSGSQYTWNDTGLMASDSGFGITAITYNDFGLPVKFHTQDRKAYTAYSYSADGALQQKEVSTSTSSPFPFTSKSETTYSAGRIFYSATRSNPLGTYVSYFPGGYFDSNGAVHYMHLDYQGSVVMETDSTGHIEKHRGYYPYGEPWTESTNKKTLAASVAQPQTYQSKERTAVTGDYDFGPRRYISAAPFWRAPDPKAHDYPNISPYAFCAANPIRYADPTGMHLYVMNHEGDVIKTEIDENMDYIQIVNDKGEIQAQSEIYDYGTIKFEGKKDVITHINKIPVKDKNGNQIQYQTLKVDGDEAGKEIFEFLADNITGNNGVEFSLTQVGAEGSGANYITTSNCKKTEYGAGQLYYSKFQYNWYLRTMIHSHPQGEHPSEGDGTFKNEISNTQNKKNQHVPIFQIYHAKTKKYIPY